MMVSFERLLRGCAAAGAALAGASAAYVAGLVLEPRAAIWLAVAAAAAVLVAGARWTMAAPRLAAGGRARGYWLALGAASLVFAVLFAEHSLRHPQGEWDAWMIWNLRARSIERSGSVARALDPALETTHPDYPLLLPGLVALAWRASAGETTAVPVAIAAAFTALCAATLIAAAGALRGPRSAAVAGLALLGTPAFVTYSVKQYADLPLAAYLLAGTALLAVALERAGRPIAAGAICALAAWSKNEGVYAFAAVVAALLLCRRTRAAAWFILGAAPALAVFAIFKVCAPAANDLVRLTTAAGLLHRLVDPARYATIAGALFLRVFHFKDWSLFAPALIALAVVSWRRRPLPGSGGVLGAVAALQLGLVASVYLATPKDLAWHIAFSMDRLLYQRWPVVLLAAVLALPPLDEEPV